MTLTPEQLDEMERGLAGVTPGPWVAFSGSSYSVWNREGEVRGVCLPYGPRTGDLKKIVGMHIARCDPATIAELIRGYRIGIAASQDVPGVLCYVEGTTAFFTTAPLSEQWGDDWNDAPYEHNAGRPYQADGVLINEVPFQAGSLRDPCAEFMNSPYSVKDINSGKVPWLVGGNVAIWAGETFADFCKGVSAAGGAVLVPIRNKEATND